MSGTETAAVMLGVSQHAVRVMMKMKIINIGYVIPNKTGRNTYIVVPEMLEMEVKRRGSTS